MSDTQKQEVEQLVAAGKLEEAKARIKEILAAPTTPEEKAAVQVAFAKLYMDVMNRLNRLHLAALDGILADAKAIDVAEGGFKTKVEIAKKRAELHKEYDK